MVWRHRGAQLTVEHYHGIPAGWRSDQIVAVHSAMKGSFPISEFEIGRWSAPAWLPERYEWLRYRATLNRIAIGVRSADAACVEIAIRYIELRYIGSYSGFLRAKLSRSLKGASLDAKQKARLNRHFLQIVLTRDYTEEFRDYCALWGRIIDESTIAKVRAHFKARSAGHLNWLAKLEAAYERLSHPPA